jgi:hypothetical protein
VTCELQFCTRFVGSVPGVDVMITIFGDFSQFLAKKLAFFLNTNVMIKFFQHLALFRVKNANFIVKFFGENILKNHNIGPSSSAIPSTAS